MLKNKPRLHKNVKITALTSFFTDISSEMLYPVIQAFISLILASRSALIGPVLGIIEGVGESTASLLRVFVGYYSDRLGKRKGLAISGYGMSALAKGLLFLSTAGWYFVVLYRFFDRVGKGIRTAPRDALISESTPKEIQGRAFGFQRAMDFAGATVGVALLYFISLKYLDPVTHNIHSVKDFYNIFILSIYPAVIGTVFLFFIKEPKSTANIVAKVRPKPNLDFRTYDRNLQFFFLAQLLFTIGNSSNQFLLLRSMNLGVEFSTVVLMYLFFNLSSTLLSTWFGSLSDRIGRKSVLVWGYILYAFVYSAFGLVTKGSSSLLWVIWIVYGIYYAMTEGVEKAFVADIAPEGSKATALGFYHTIVGAGLLPASLAAGFLFSVSPSAPFLFGSFMSVLAIVVLLGFVREKEKVESRKF